MFRSSRPAERDDNPEIKTGFFTSPARKSPAEQWAYAEELEHQGKLSRSARAYRNLMYKWPNDPLAPRAQERRADLHLLMNEPDQAFKHYRFLVERYPDRIAYDQIIHKMIDLATGEEARIRGKFLFLPGFADPAQAIPLYRAIIQQAPRHPRAPHCLLRIAQIHYEEYDFAESIAVCNELIAAYPQSPEAEEAAYQKILSSLAAARESRNDDQSARVTRVAALMFIDQYPHSPQVESARDIAQEMYNRLAKAQWSRAQYYDRISKKPKAALLAYQKLIEQFPVSEWTEPAQKRINQLSIAIEPPALKP